MHFTREPGGTPVAELFRGLLLDPAVELDAWTEAYLSTRRPGRTKRGGT